MAKINIKNLIIKPNRFPHIPKSKGVYMLTDSTGKSYIGSTSNMNKRVSGHSTIKGFDYSNFTAIVLEDCKYLTKQECLQLELDHIVKHDTIYPKGYNKRSPLTMLPFGVKPKRANKVVKWVDRTPTNYGKQVKYNVNIMAKYFSD